MTLKAIEARFTSGNDIPVQKAMVPADEWFNVMLEVKMMRASLETSIATSQASLKIIESMWRERDVLMKEIERLQQEVSTLQRIVAESYQVMGILADEAGRFDDPHVIKALDNAGLIELQHEDVLPFPCKPETTRMYTIASAIQDTCDRQAMRLAEAEKEIDRLRTALKLIEWSNDSQLQAQAATEALKGNS